MFSHWCYKVHCVVTTIFQPTEHPSSQPSTYIGNLKRERPSSLSVVNYCGNMVVSLKEDQLTVDIKGSTYKNTATHSFRSVTIV